MHTATLLAVAALVTGLLAACTLDAGGNGVSKSGHQATSIAKRHGAGRDE